MQSNCSEQEVKDVSSEKNPMTFDIPEALQGMSKIDIRMENDTLGFASFTTLKNR